MIHLYYIDNDNLSGNNDLSTYSIELTKQLEQHKLIKLTLVWLNSNRYNVVAKHEIAGAVHIYIPSNITLKRAQNDADAYIAGILSQEFGIKKNVIAHFNWINH